MLKAIVLVMVVEDFGDAFTPNPESRKSRSSRCWAEAGAAPRVIVAPANPSRVLYEAMGFRRVGTSGTSWTLRLDCETV